MSEEVSQRVRGRQRTLQGVVRSNKMQKSVVVEVSYRVMHPVYKKYITRLARYMAHDANNEYQPGDIVRLTSSAPKSRRKRWRVSSLVERPR